MFVCAQHAESTLSRYVEKAVQLQLAEAQSVQSRRELEVRIGNQGQEIRRLERSLKQAAAAGERQLITLQKVGFMS